MGTNSIQNSALADLSISIARTHVGKKEATGHNDGPFVNMIQEFVGGAAEHGAPWCACFASYCIYMAAKQLGITPKFHKTDSSSVIFSDAKHNGTVLSAPIKGAIGLIRGDGGTPGKTHHHTFRVISVDAALGIVYTIDGNWGNQVCLASHRIKDCDFVAVT